MTLAEAKKILEPLPKETKMKLAILIEYLTKKGKQDEVMHVDMNGYFRHWGIKGMHWGIRRYQNPDGSLTEEGRKRYASNITSLKEKVFQKQWLNDPKHLKKMTDAARIQRASLRKEVRNTSEYKQMKKLEKEIAEMQNEKEHLSLNRLTGGAKVSDEFVKKYTAYDDVSERYIKKAQDITNRYGENLVSTMMKDLGYSNYQEAAQYVVKNKWIDFTIDVADFLD